VIRGCDSGLVVSSSAVSNTLQRADVQLSLTTLELSSTLPNK
jgi:hypothetical protein